jgi:hypothetical protein
MSDVKLREGLLGAEGVTPELERRYRERLQALVERRATPASRATHVFGLVLSAGLVAFFVYQLVLAGSAASPILYLGLAVGLAFSVGWGVLAAISLASRKEDLRTHALARDFLVVGFNAALLGIMLWAGMTTADAARGVRVMLYGLAFWAAFGIPSLFARLLQMSELRTRMDVLRLELALARMAERGEPGA